MSTGVRRGGCRGGGIVRRDVVDFERIAVSESRPSAIDVLLHEGAEVDERGRDFL
jgi:hypothetical protein